MSRFNYADFVLLSSTISYAISEETSLDDLEILITFLGMISTDLTLLLIKRRRSVYNQQADIDDETQDVSDDDANISLSRNLNTKTIKRVKRKKRKKIP